MSLLQAANVAANSDGAPSQASPELTWFFGGMALVALVLTWIWLWTKMRQSMEERARLREELERLAAANAEIEAENPPDDEDGAEKNK